MFIIYFLITEKIVKHKIIPHMLSNLIPIPEFIYSGEKHWLIIIILDKVSKMYTLLVLNQFYRKPTCIRGVGAYTFLF